MKKLLIFVLSLVLLTASASAEPWPWFNIHYNAAASLVGAEKIEGKSVKTMSVNEKDDSIYASFGKYDAGFTFDSSDNLVSALVRCSDDSASLDFLLTCMSCITAFGSFDEDAYGSLLYQFARVRAGKETDAHILGIDAFQVKQGTDGFKYHFVYLNRDLSYAN